MNTATTPLLRRAAGTFFFIVGFGSYIAFWVSERFGLLLFSVGCLLLGFLLDRYLRAGLLRAVKEFRRASREIVG